MVATVAVKQRTIGAMPVRRSDEDARPAILIELRKRERVGHEAPTWEELAAALDVSVTTARYHSRTLARLCLVRLSPMVHRGIALTEAGRLAADCLLTSDG